MRPAGLMGKHLFPFSYLTIDRMSDKYDEDHIREIQRMRMTLDEETGMQRMKRKFREEPFVPAGSNYS